MMWIIVGLVAFYCLEHLLLALTLLFRTERIPADTSPFISVLVAARNEEANILECLQTLAMQDYPADRIEVLIGDDASEDRTADLVQHFAATHPHFRYVRITSQYPGIRGKQNVLAYLAHQARGEILIITDADVIQPPRWAASLVGAFTDPRVGVVSGPTVVQGNGWFTAMQGLDWLMGVAVIKGYDLLGMPITSIGNNMAVRKTAYEQVGGYEQLAFSITEDYKLFKEILARGWRHRWWFGPPVLNRSKPIETLNGLLHQRKRWYLGGREGMWYATLLLGFHVLVVPLLVAAWVIVPMPIWWGMLGGKIGADLVLGTVAALKLGQPRILNYFPLHALYTLVFQLLLPLYFLKPGPVIWKGRVFR